MFRKSNLAIFFGSVLFSVVDLCRLKKLNEQSFHAIIFLFSVLNYRHIPVFCAREIGGGADRRRTGGIGIDLDAARTF